MSSAGASAALRKSLQNKYGDKVPGCVFYVTRNGEPFADGSFGWARLPSAPDGLQAMSPNSLVHIGSVGKFFCAVAILRLIQEWNSIIDPQTFAPPVLKPPASPFPPPAASPEEATLHSTVWKYKVKLDLNTAMFPLVSRILDQNLIASYASFPGANVENITFRQLLTHTSRLPRRDLTPAEVGVTTREEVYLEPPDQSPTIYNLSKIVTARLHLDATAPAPQYNNGAFSVLGAVIEAVTGRTYVDWVRQRLFGEPQFNDLARKVSARERFRAARYYILQNGSFVKGNYHPDYTNYSAAGGWYVSAEKFCEWLDTLMQKKKVRGKPILENPQELISGMLGLDGTYTLGKLHGAWKNGGAAPGGGTTNCRFAFLRGDGDERVCAFVLVNSDISANPILDTGLQALKEYLG